MFRYSVITKGKIIQLIKVMFISPKDNDLQGHSLQLPSELTARLANIDTENIDENIVDG